MKTEFNRWAIAWGLERRAAMSVGILFVGTAAIFVETDGPGAMMLVDV